MTLDPSSGDQRDTSVDSVKTIDLTPTVDGYKIIRLALMESNSDHNQDLRTLDLLEAELNDGTYHLVFKTEHEKDLLLEVIEKVRQDREIAVAETSITIREIEDYLEAIGE